MSAIPQFVCAYPRLSELPEGTHARVVLFRVDRDEERRLVEMGIRVGSRVQVLRHQPNGPSLVAVGDARMALGASTAAAILVSTVGDGEETAQADAVGIEEMAVGDSGRVTGFRKGSSAYRKKLLAMGVTPGTTFTITRVAPLGDPIELVIRGFLLTLRKAEAATLLIEAIPSQAA